MNIISYILSSTYETSKCKLMLDAQKTKFMQWVLWVVINIMFSSTHNLKCMCHPTKTSYFFCHFKDWKLVLDKIP
jgi:hypothetical protein